MGRKTVTKNPACSRGRLFKVRVRISGYTTLLREGDLNAKKKKFRAEISLGISFIGSSISII